MPSDEMWRQTELRQAAAAEWQRDAANTCGGCGRATAAGEFIWLWGTGRRATVAHRGLYCRDCGAPAGEPRGADIAASVRRSVSTG